MDNKTSLITNLHFTPMISDTWMIVACVLSGLVLILSAFQYRKGIALRCIMFAAFMLALLNPSLIKEERSYVKDVAVIVTDRSTSQNIEQRTERTDIALAHIQKQIEDTGAADLRVIEAPKAGSLTNRTDLFSALDQTLIDVPQKQRAGVIFLTDGQIHDVPKTEDAFTAYGPVHQLLSGKKNERDRQIVITSAPAYGLVGKEIIVKYKVEDSASITGQSSADITITMHDGKQLLRRAPINTEQSITLPLDHAGQNVFSIEVDSVKDEITTANNKTAVIVNGVRDRLKVLLVSGIPHAGERTWRGLLKSDPGVDLVHFTILREPQKFDYTPKNELSLIAFPFRELFEIKLYDFDLIVFDRYRVNNILPDRYFRNIVKYVQEGGAFLEASGPAFAGKRSIYDTPLADILPAKPTGVITEQRFNPTISEMGLAHPVTKNLIWNNKTVDAKGNASPWGAWLRYIDITPSRGDILMQAMNEKPLLVLDRVGKGRVAQLSSDHIWLWSRGYDGGGPHAELLRRIVHWLMKEPELDERALNVTVNKDSITIRKQAFNTEEETIALTYPDGERGTITLNKTEQNLLEHKMKADQLGVYAFEDVNGTRKFVVVGDLNPPELSGVRTTNKNLDPLVSASGGTTIWLDNTPTPNVSMAAQNARRYGGANWVALKRNNDFTVTGVRDISLLPNWSILLILLSLLLGLWSREGQSK